MVSTEAARTIVGILGNATSLFLFLSPVPTFVRIWKKESVEEYSPIPYLAAMVNCMLWVLYGLPMVHPHSTLVVTVNGLGCIIEVGYLVLFLSLSGGRKRLGVLVVMLFELIFVGVVTILVLSLAHTYGRRSMVVGTLCILFNAIMYASPLAVMKLVITTKSVEYMPLSLSLASLANSVAWAGYALIRFDPFIIIPNGLGALLSVAQLILYGAYYRSTQQQMAARKSKGEMSLVEEPAVNEDSSKMSSVQNGHV